MSSPGDQPPVSSQSSPEPKETNRPAQSQRRSRYWRVTLVLAGILILVVGFLFYSASSTQELQKLCLRLKEYPEAEVREEATPGSERYRSLLRFLSSFPGGNWISGGLNGIYPIESLRNKRIRIPRNAEMTPEEWGVLTSSHQVIELDFSSVKLNEAQASQVGRMKWLQNLRLREVSSSSRILSLLPKLSGLKDLNIRRSTVSPEMINACHELPLLESLGLHDCEIDKSSTLPELRLKNLSSLSLIRTLLPESMVKNALHQNDDLTSFTLIGFKLSEELLNDISTKQSIQYLSLSESHFPQDRKSRLGVTGSLMRLDLRKSSIDQSTLIEFLNNPGIAELDLSETGFSDSILPHLDRLKHLTDLNVSGTNITDSVVDFVKSHPTLRLINLSKTKVTSEGIKKIERRDLKIYQ